MGLSIYEIDLLTRGRGIGLCVCFAEVIFPVITTILLHPLGTPSIAKGIPEQSHMWMTAWMSLLIDALRGLAFVQHFAIYSDDYL